MLFNIPPQGLCPLALLILMCVKYDCSGGAGTRRAVMLPYLLVGVSHEGSLNEV